MLPSVSADHTSSLTNQLTSAEAGKEGASGYCGKLEGGWLGESESLKECCVAASKPLDGTCFLTFSQLYSFDQGSNVYSILDHEIWDG